ncbi:hypothetical protein VNO77_05034 [Canavalia gladiata]|uniref:Uncharacterized protein n=1 Tax=Canavalia gladiata TaxID=3824 RepID=A0AAN9MXK9_CANGL
MGCCVSSNRKFHDSQKPFTSPQKPSESNRGIEEETVKEVLSETPKWNPTTISLSKPQKPLQNETFNKFKEEGKFEKKALSLSIHEAEDTSEICSLSETMSTTTSITDQREVREETRRKLDRSQAKLRRSRSFSGDDECRRERTVHGSRNVGLVQCRDQMGQKMSNGGNRHRGDPGDLSFRRTRPPASGADTGAAKSVLGRSPSARRTNRLHARVRTATPENGCRKMEIPAGKGNWLSASESLENPLVSLECFIFL